MASAILHMLVDASEQNIELQTVESEKWWMEVTQGQLPYELKYGYFTGKFGSRLRVFS
jgi:hypothetical protein